MLLKSQGNKDCHTSTSGGKGNEGMFIEREPRICSAGVVSAQASEKVGDSLKHYLPQEEVDALISDAIIPAPKPRPLPPLRKPMKLDMRNVLGPCGQVASVVNPPNRTKFQAIVEDLKETIYTSYWAAQLGKSRDPVPMFPEGYDIKGTTYGKKVGRDSLYDIIMPRKPVPDKTPPSKGPSYQTNRNYCKPPYNPDLTYGHRSGIDKRGRYAKCCLTDDNVVLGTASKTPMNTIASNFLAAKEYRLGKALTPNNNIKKLPEGFSFGKPTDPANITECLIYCDINDGIFFLRKCMKALNTLRKFMRTRFLPTFFRTFYLQLKYFDKEKTGWLPKDVVYNFSATKSIRFDTSLIEPLLSLWRAFDGQRIEYKTYVLVLNFKEPSPDIPKIRDVPLDCLDFNTTYRDMVKPDKPPDLSRMAGLPSGRYFDMDLPVTPLGCCKADRICLPHESDMKSCLSPSVLTQLFVNHRDMYAKREPDIVRKVFEAMNGKFTDEEFNTIWEEAKKLHSQGWVCYETFRQTMVKMEESKKCKKENET